MESTGFRTGHALLVGVGEYKDTSLSAPITARDAMALAEVLYSTRWAGYPSNQVRVLTGESATRSRVLGALKDLASITTEQDTVLLFLCGHGTPDSVGGYCFLTHDAERSGRHDFNPFTKISSVELVSAIKKIPARKMLILLNTCFSGAVPANLGSNSPVDLTPDAPLPDPALTPPPSEVLDQVLGAGEGRVIISACRSTQKSWYSKGQSNTLFVQALLDGLQGSEGIASRNGYIGVFELYDYLYEKVREGAQELNCVVQEPVITIREGVGPFPVALYHGGRNLGADTSTSELNSQPAEEAGDAVRIVPQVRVGRDYNQATGGGVVNTGTMGNVQTGGGTQWNIGSVSSGRDSYIGSTVNQSQYGGIRFGDNTQVKGTVIGGDVSAPIFSGTAYGPVNQGSGSQTVAGRDINQGGAELAQVFAEAIRRVQAMPEDDREIATPIVRQAQAQAEKLQQGDTSPETESALERRLKQLMGVAPDIAEVVLASLANPAAGVVAAIRKIAQRVIGSQAG
jgi:hypothetical protein